MELPPAHDLEDQVTVVARGGVLRPLAESAAPDWKAGAKIGRFSVIERIGQGGMGVVYAGYDDRLDRRVALKVIRPELGAGGRGKGRLWREAQAMARISHPNVVQVHEVGRTGESVYVVMEFIPGQTLKQWLQSGPAQHEVLAAFVAAGRGLRAAHELGMVHRDFKPVNVMRSTGAEVKVLDFGLAQNVGEPAEATAGMDVPAGDAGGWSSQVTGPGIAMGTMPYMSPEQQTGAHIDARCDQYSYCVSLWQGLTGALPFGSGPAAEVLKAKLAGPPAWPKGVPAIPARVLDALRRGLAPQPKDRWPSMQALLGELQPDPARRVRSWSLGLAGTAALGLAGGSAHVWAEQRSQRCSGASEMLEGIWDPGRRAEAKAAVLAVELPYAEEVWSRTERTLDAYAAQWVEMRTDACRVAADRPAANGSVLDTQMRCFHDARLGLGATVATLVDADEQVVKQAHRVAGTLRPLQWCENAEMLAAVEEPPLPEDARAVEEGRKALARSVRERAAGRPDAAWAMLERASIWLDGVEYGPAQTELALERGEVQQDQGMYMEAERSFNEVIELALIHGQESALFEAAVSLLYVVGVSQERTRQGLLYWPIVRTLSRGREDRWAHAQGSLGRLLEFQGKYAEAEAAGQEAIRIGERIRGPEDPNVANARNSLGNALIGRGRYRDAESAYRAALAAQEAALGAVHPAVATSRSNLGVALARQGKRADAEVQFRLALQLRERALGPDHLDVAMSLHNLGAFLQTEGRLEEAESASRRALQIQERAWGTEHPSVALSHITLGMILGAQGRHDESVAEHRAAVRIQERLLGPAHPKVAMARNGLGTALESQGRGDEAEVEFRAALKVASQALGPDHPDVAYARINLGHRLADRRQFRDAEVHLREALRIRENALGETHPRVATAALSLGRAKMQQGLLREALPLASRAWTTLRESEALPQQSAEAALLLAKILWSVDAPDRDRARACTVAEQAVAAMEDASGELAATVASLHSWLASHRAACRHR